MKYKKPKPDKYEQRELRRQRMEQTLKGSGQYLFVNNTRGDLELIKPPIQGPNPSIAPEKQKTIPAGKTFIGDSYFLCLLKSNDVRLIEVIQPADAPNQTLNERKEELMTEERKLILDQPERFTQKGQTEQVIPDSNGKTLNEQMPAKKDATGDKLLTEDPLAGVEILLS